MRLDTEIAAKNGLAQTRLITAHVFSDDAELVNLQPKVYKRDVLIFANKYHVEVLHINAGANSKLHLSYEQGLNITDKAFKNKHDLDSYIQDRYNENNNDYELGSSGIQTIYHLIGNNEKDKNVTVSLEIEVNGTTYNKKDEITNCSLSGLCSFPGIELSDKLVVDVNIDEKNFPVVLYVSFSFSATLFCGAVIPAIIAFVSVNWGLLIALFVRRRHAFVKSS